MRMSPVTLPDERNPVLIKFINIDLLMANKKNCDRIYFSFNYS